MLGFKDKSVTLVGAGPVGSPLSIFLARRGFQVEIYERRPDMRRETISAGRSINLAISTRGLNALAQIGLEKRILEQAVPMKGRVIHPIKGPLTFQPYGKDESQYINSISRGGLNQVLMDAAELHRASPHPFQEPRFGTRIGEGRTHGYRRIHSRNISATGAGRYRNGRIGFGGSGSDDSAAGACVFRGFARLWL